MGNLIKTVGWSVDNAPTVKKMVGYMSDGTAVAVIEDPNQTGVSGDGGDNTDAPKFYVYTQAVGGSTWTLRESWTATISGRPNYSMAIGANNNIHIVYRTSTGGLFHYLLTYNGSYDWTVPGSPVSIAADPGTNQAWARVDIDVMGTGNNAVVVAFHYNRTSGSEFSRLTSWIRTNAGTWVQMEDKSWVSNRYELDYTDSVTVAAEQSAISGNIAYYAFAGVRKTRTGTDYGDLCYINAVNVSTGALLSTRTVFPAFNKGIGGGYREYKLFNTAQYEFTLTGSVNTNPWQGSMGRFTFDPGTYAPTVTVPISVSPRMGAVDRTTHRGNWGEQSWGGDACLFFGKTTNYTYSFVGRIFPGDTTVTWNSVTNRRWEEGYKAFGIVGPSQVFAGHSRNAALSRHMVLFTYIKSGSTNAYRIENAPLVAYNREANTLLPGNGSTVSTNRPTFKAEHKPPLNQPQFRTRIEYGLATDASFATNYRHIATEDPYITAEETLKSGVSVTSQYALREVDELFQGTWYARAVMVDEMGRQSSAETTPNQFVVSHPPAPKFQSPTGGKVLMYGTGDVTFNWVFTDPSPGDVQTEYHIEVEVNADGTSVVDTGWVTSSSANAVLNIPDTYKDIELRWRVTLRDFDGVDSTDTTWSIFVVTAEPDPVIIDPTAGEVLTTAVPTITWDPGVGSAKEQTAYRVNITQGVTTVHSSTWVSNADTSYQIPTGILHNGNQYTVLVTVRDNFRMEGQTNVNFSTSWVPPDPPGPKAIYLSEFAKNGFVYISQDPAGADPDFVSMKLYRRKYGEVNWSEITEWTDASSPMAYRDWFVSSDSTYEYATTQLVDRFGDIIESQITNDEIYTVQPYSENYWLLHPLETSDKSIPLFQATADSFTEEYEQETYQLIGRGRKTEYGDRLGYSGELSMQLRDKWLTGLPKINYLLNPSMHMHLNGDNNPDSWLVDSSGSITDATGDFITPLEPTPSGKDVAFRYQTSEMGDLTTDYIRVYQDVSLNNVPGVNVITFSVYLWTVTNRRIRLKLEWYNGVTLTDTDQFADPAVFEYYIDPSNMGSPDFESQSGATGGNWGRYQISVPWRTGNDRIRPIVQVEGKGIGQAETQVPLIVSAAQLELGPLTSYFDGSRLGAIWLGSEWLAPSQTDGSYTARQQRQKIEALKSEKRDLYIRSPFGDLWLVATGNISVTRIAGVGNRDFVDVSMPYQEVVPDA